MPHSDQTPERAAILFSGAMSYTDVLLHLSDAAADFVTLCSLDFEVLQVNQAMKARAGLELSQNGTMLYHKLIGADGPLKVIPAIDDTDNQAVVAHAFNSSKLGRIVVKGYATQTGENEVPGILLIAHPMDYSSTPPVHNSALPDISAYQLMDALPDAAFLCDQEGEIVYCSAAAPLYFGFADKSKIIGSNYQSFFTHDSLDQSFIFFNSVATAQTGSRSAQFGLRTLSGSAIVAQVNFALVKSSPDTASRVLILFGPVMMTGSDTEKLIRKEARLSRICDIMLENRGKGPSSQQKLLSQFGEMTGAMACSYAELTGDSLEVKLSWNSPFNQHIPVSLGSRQLFDHITSTTGDITLIRKPLLYTFLESEGFDCDDAGVKALLGVPVLRDNAVKGIISAVFAHNISTEEIDNQLLAMVAGSFTREEAQPVEKSAAVSGFSYRELLDCFTDAVFILTPAGVLTEINQGAVDMYGYPHDELTGRTAEFLSAPGKNDLELLQQRMQLAAVGETQRFEWWGMRKNGEIFPKEVVLSKGRYYDQEVLIAIGRDLTDRIKAEQELLQSNKELTETNLSKDKFFSILAHDLKNPFQGLLGFIDLLYDDLDELTTEQIREYLFNVRSASYQTYSLLENLLDWSRIQSGKMPFTPTVFDISGEIESVFSVLGANADRKHIRLVNDVPKDTMVEADKNMMRSVIQNLVTNSIKFSNTKGKVVIRSRSPLTHAAKGNGAEAESTRWLEVSVADNGIGIPEELLPRLFSLDGKFSQSGTANEPGTGLGLVLCREMVEKNGGRIWAESIAGQGATFIFTVPLKG